MNVKRYEWEDALIESQRNNRINNGALLLALKLSRAINWTPKGKPPGLYWKNQDALIEVGASRATYFRYRESLFETGFFTEVSGNLLPTLPESQVETTESLGETDKSQVETTESLGDNPFTVDTFSEDVLTVDECTEEPAGAASLDDKKERPLTLVPNMDGPPLSQMSESLPCSSGEVPQSQVETDRVAELIKRRKEQIERHGR